MDNYITSLTIDCLGNGQYDQIFNSIWSHYYLFFFKNHGMVMITISKVQGQNTNYI